jgi:fructosamine-3-kinase
MTTEIATRLNAQFDTYGVIQQIHDVPPHAVYEVTVDGRRAIYKENTGQTGRATMEGQVTKFIGKNTSVPVPEVLYVGESYYVAEWHDDAPVPDDRQTADEKWAFAAGTGLARLHDETAPLVDSYGAFQPTADGLSVDGHEQWHEAAIDYVRGRRPVLDRFGHADVADLVIEYLEAHPDAFAGAGEAVCCHGWATPEHVSVIDGEIACLLDFEHAIAAPSEYDYWRTVGPAFGPDNDDARNAFREGFESVRPLPDEFDRRAPLYGLLNFIYFFESLYVQNQHDSAKTTEKAGRFEKTIHNILNDLRT